MANNMHLHTKDLREERHSVLIEVSESEKQLVMLFYTKGPLHNDVRDLYRKLRSCYEKIILHDNEQSEVQDLEYCLWKLHYKHIDEFRKRTKTKVGEQHNAGHVEGFKLFLSEATEFYQNLVVKIRKWYRLPDESSFYRRGDIASFPEPKKVKKCHFLCHRFLVCLGDLSRYREQYEKPDARDHNWSMAATYYMEATAIWPDSGNPQNQLAVLATYVGDEFLALYHCIRSLAVKEPFPDARDNLTVLLERNRASSPLSLPIEARFNFLKPSERCFKPSNGSSAAATTDVWSLFIRLISFFFIESSFDDFPSIFALFMRELDSLMALDDNELRASLESYRKMDSVKTGPFRALQAVSILLYTIQNQAKGFEDASVARQWAMPAAFVFMGRFVERCLKAETPSSCPLLPAVLVFAEWFANKFEEGDEKNRIAMSYFLCSYSDLLKGFGVGKRRAGSSDKTPLWEDYELRGFAAVASTHEALDFSSRWECVEDFEKGTEHRARRVINAGLTIVSVAAAEEEEVILFSPLPRHKSAPEEPNTPPDDLPAAERISAGPPSLSAWVVVDGENPISIAKKHTALSSIEEEAASESLYGLSIADRGKEDSAGPPPFPSSSPLYAGAAPPSAPLLPDDEAAWYSQQGPAVSPNSWTAAAGPVPVQVQPRQMTSSEWLRHYLQTHHHHLVDFSSQGSPWYYYAGPGVETQQVAPAVYGGGYYQYQYQQRANLCGDMMAGEPQPLLHYLKERERQLQGLHNNPSSYLGN